MSDDRWNTVLVLGGIRSGKSAFAEALVADAPAVRYVATAAGGEDDPEWLARIEEHQRRRPQAWSTVETGADPTLLTELLTEAKPDETLLVDDLGGWVASLLDPARQPNDDEADVAALADAVRRCTARVVLVSPEVGLALVPTTPIGRAFTDALGSTNQALAEACDRVALVVAGRAVWLKDVPEPVEPVTAVPFIPAVPPRPEAPADDETVVVTPVTEETVVEDAVVAASPVVKDNAVAAAPAVEDDAVAATPAAPTAAAVIDEPTQMVPLVESGLVIQPGMDLPMPDADSGPDARDRLITLDFPGAGLGTLVEAVEFAAGVQSTTVPQPWESPRVLLIAGEHAGGAAAGDDAEDVRRRVDEVVAGTGVLSRLAATAGADVAVLRTEASGAIEDGPASDDTTVDRAIRRGWQLAESAAEAGRDVLVLAAIGVGTDAVATAVSAATTGAEPVAILPRVRKPGGFYDDEAWMVRCAAVRDALHRIRQSPRGAHDILRELGGTDLSVAVGVLLGATSRKLPVLLDGPVGIAAGLIARDLAGQSRHWCLLPDDGNLELVRQGADVLGLEPVLNLGLGLGEGANATAALPLLRTAIGLAAAVPVHPALVEESAAEGDGEADAEGDSAGSDDAGSNGAAGSAAGSNSAASSAAASNSTASDDAGSDADFVEPETRGPGPATTA